MPGGMTRQRDELHAVHDRLGAAERVPLAGLDIWRCDGLGALEERLRILRRLGCDLWRQPKVALSLRDVNLGIWEDAFSIVTGQAADMIGWEVRDQNQVDLLRPIASAAEAARQAPERSPPIPGASASIDEDQLLAVVDQEAQIGGIQQVRILVQCLCDTIYRRFLSLQPGQLEYGGRIVEGCHFEIADLQSEKARRLITDLWRRSQSGGRTGHQAGERRHKRCGEAHRIDLHFSTPRASQSGTGGAWDCSFWNLRCRSSSLRFTNALTIVIKVAGDPRRG